MVLTCLGGGVDGTDPGQGSQEGKMEETLGFPEFATAPLYPPTTANQLPALRAPSSAAP